MASERLRLPLFPLHSVLFPGGPLSLRIFEPRYLDMISRCMREDGGFGVVLIRDGGEVGEVAIPHAVGTLGKITYFHERKDGLLGITVTGERRFRILESEAGADKLLQAEVELLEEEGPLPIEERHRPLVQLLEQILEQLDHPYRTLERRYDDAGWVAARLAELMPIPLTRKQLLLEMEGADQRIAALLAMLEEGR